MKVICTENSRTISEFLLQYAKEKGFYIPFSRYDPKHPHIGYEEFNNGVSQYTLHNCTSTNWNKLSLSEFIEFLDNKSKLKLGELTFVHGKDGISIACDPNSVFTHKEVNDFIKQYQTKYPTK